LKWILYVSQCLFTVVWRHLATDLDFVLLGFQACTAVARFRLR